MTERMALMDIVLSRLFHDLISPVSATVNGAELIADMGGGAGGELEQEALTLIGNSARQASERLSFFRVAFGGAGSTADHSAADAAALVEPYLKARKIEFALTCPGDPKSVRPPLGGVKVSLAFVCALCETLPRGGRIEMDIADSACSTIEITARGEGAILLPEVATALDAEVSAEDLTSRSVVAYMAAENARRFGFGVVADHDDGRVTFRLETS